MESDNRKWSYRSTDEFLNDWTWFTTIDTPIGELPSKTPTNNIRNENPFTDFDFTYMTDAEVTFLRRIANGIYPYEKDFGRYYYLDIETKEGLRNCLNWAPLFQELYPDESFTRGNIQIGELDEQIRAYQLFYTVSPESERFGRQRPVEFLLNDARRNLKGSFTLKPSSELLEEDNIFKNNPELRDTAYRDYIKVGNLDEIIRTGKVPNELLLEKHRGSQTVNRGNLRLNFPSIPIHPRELVYYIRRKYGISTTPWQVGNTLNNLVETSKRVSPQDGKVSISFFQKYVSEFLFENQEKLPSNTRNTNQFILNNIKNFQDLYGNLNGGREYFGDPPSNVFGTDEDIVFATSLSAQSRISLLDQTSFTSRYFDILSQSTTLVFEDAIKIVERTYNSINTEKLNSNFRARHLLEKTIEFGDVITRGLDAGTISMVSAEITKTKDEPKEKSSRTEFVTILNDEEILNKEINLNPTSLIMRNSNFSEPEIISQFISNISNPRENDLDYKYHIRPWNKTGYVVSDDGGLQRDPSYDMPLFQKPKYWADYYKKGTSNTSCSAPKEVDRYYMRNVIRPDLEEILLPPTEGNSFYNPEFSDMDRYSVDLTLIELSSIGIKYNPLIEIESDRSTTPLSNFDYRVFRNLAKNKDDDGSVISDSINEFTSEIIDRYLYKKGLLKSSAKFIYKTKKNLNVPIISTILTLELTNWVVHTADHYHHVASPVIGRFYKQLSIGLKNNITKNANHFAHSIHHLVFYLEIPVVIFKVISGIAQIVMYNDAASYIATFKELAIGGLAIEALREGSALPIFIASRLGISTSAAGFWIAAVLTAISLYVDQVVGNVRHSDKRKKFEKLIKKAHESGYLEGPYAESGGSIIIKKKDVISVLQKNDGTKTNVVNPIGNEYITSFEELMGSKGNRLFWDKIKNNPIECKTLLDIYDRSINQPSLGLIKGKELDVAPSKLDVGWFTDMEKYSIDGDDTVASPFYGELVQKDQYTPYIWKDISFELYKVWLTNKNQGNLLRLLPSFRYSRAPITNNTNLTNYLNGIEKSTEFIVTFGDPTLGNNLSSIEKVNSVYYQSSSPSVLDIEKVWLIRKKYGLDLTEPSDNRNNDCCLTFNPTTEGTGLKILDEIDGLSNNRNLQSFITKYGRRCEYKVPFNSDEFISKLREICGGKSRAELETDTRRNKIRKPSTVLPPPVVRYDNKIDTKVVNDQMSNYADELSKATQTLNTRRGDSGDPDPLKNEDTAPRFAKKTDLIDQIDISTNPVPSNDLSAFLVGFATLDIGLELRRFINTISTAYFGSFGNDRRPSDEIDFASLNKGGSNEILNGGPWIPIDNPPEPVGNQSSPTQNNYGPNILI